MATQAKLKDIIDGMEFQSDEINSYLNKVTGKVVTIPNEAFNAVESGDDSLYDFGPEMLEEAREVSDGKDWISLPDRFDIDEYRMMENFALSVEDDKSSGLLQVALQGSGAFRRFKDTAIILKLEQDWYDYRNRAYKEAAIDWCKAYNIEYADE